MTKKRLALYNHGKVLLSSSSSLTPFIMIYPLLCRSSCGRVSVKPHSSGDEENIKRWEAMIKIFTDMYI